MAFVVDSSEWNAEKFASPSAFVEALTALVGRVQIALNRHEVVWIGDDLQSTAIMDGHDLWSLTEAGLELPGELLQELGAWLGHARYYIDEEVWPVGFESFNLCVDGEVVDCADVSWAHHCTLARRPVACLGLQRNGVFRTESATGETHVRWVRDEFDHVSFWRDVIASNDSDGQLQALAQHAFPDLFFVENVWRGIRDFNGGYRAVSMKLRNALSVLNDHGAWVFITSPPNLHPAELRRDEGSLPTNQLIQQRFSGLGLTVSPEAIEVRQDGNCRRAREVMVRGRVLYCEWHEKIEPHQNRIYFHPPVAESDNKTVIGFLTHHLPLP